MAFRIRRIVTGHDPAGRSVVAIDEEVESVAGRFDARVGRYDPWWTKSSPPEIDGPDPTRGEGTVTPLPGGTIFRILEIPPGNDRAKHRTETVDYYIILKGELYMTMDVGEVLCRAGDVIVQRSTNHGWDNRGAEPAMFAEVLIDARGSTRNDL